MEFAKLFSVFDSVTADDQRQAFATVRGQLRGVATALQGQVAAQSRGAAIGTEESLAVLTRQVDAVDVSTLLLIQSSLPIFSRGKFGRFRRELGETLRDLRSQCETKGMASEAHLPRFGAVVSQLDEWQEKAIRAKERRSWGLGVFGFLAAAAAPVFLFFQYYTGGIETDSVVIVFPSDPYQVRSWIGDAELSQTREPFDVVDRKAFLADFSLFYFGHPNRLLEQHYQGVPPGSEADKRPPPLGKAAPPVTIEPATQLGGQSKPEELRRFKPLRWKILLKNTSLRTPEFVSDVRESVELVEPHTFPWNELPIAADLSMQIAGFNFVVENSGVGPAIEMAWNLKSASGSRIGKGTQFVLRGLATGNAPVITEKDWQAMYVIDRTSRGRQHADEVSGELLAIDKLPEGVDPAEVSSDPSEAFTRGNRYFKEDDHFFEYVDTVKRLKEIADEVVESVDVTLRFEDLAGNVNELVKSLPLPDNVVFYRHKVRLEKGGPVQAPTQKGAPTGGSAARLLYALANAFTPPEGSNPARESLQAQFDFDLIRVEPGKRASLGNQFDVSLAPQGHISIYSSAIGVQTGTYRIAVAVNGRPKTEFQLKFLNPELRWFPKERTMRFQEIRWFRQTIGKTTSDQRMSNCDDDMFVEPLHGSQGLEAPKELYEERWTDESRINLMPELAPQPPAPVPAAGPGPK